MTEGLRTQLVTALVLGLVFAAGAVVGAAVDRSVFQAAEIASAESTDDDKDSDSARWIIDRVDLSAEQRTQVDSVLDDFRQDVSDLYAEIRPVYWEKVEEAREAIRAVLNDQQQARYDSLLEQSDRRWSRSDSAGEGS